MGVADVVRQARIEARGGRVETTVRELVEWTYAAQRAHRVVAGEYPSGEISQTGVICERIRRHAELGRDIDRSPSVGAYYGRLVCDDDALLVHEEVQCLARAYSEPLMRYGEMRAVPDWQPRTWPLRCVAVPGRKGQPRGIYEGDGRRMVACAVTYEGDIDRRRDYRAMRAAWPDAPTLRCVEDLVEHAREQYKVWYDGLFALADMLTWHSMRRWYVVAIGADEQPWNK